MTDKKMGLGKGLTALLGEEEGTIALNSDASENKNMLFVAVSALEASPLQPRHVFTAENLAELASSIKEKGVLQPLLVRRNPLDAEKFEIIAGERRWRAAQKAEVTEVPVIIKDFTDGEVLQVALIENLQRQNLSPLEEAEAYQRLLDDFSYTQEEIASLIGKSRSHIANTVRLLGLSDKIKNYISAGEISAGHARALLTAANPEALAAEIMAHKLNVRASEKLAAQNKNRSQKQKSSQQPKNVSSPTPLVKDANIQELEHIFSKVFASEVTIDMQGKSGNISIRFNSMEQLDDITQLIANLG